MVSLRVTWLMKKTSVKLSEVSEEVSNVKWKVVPARNSGWKKKSTYISQFAWSQWRCLNFVKKN